MKNGEIRGLLREEGGTLRPVSCFVVDGVPCDGRGMPLENTGERESLRGWGFNEAEVWKYWGGAVEVLLPTSKPD